MGSVRYKGIEYPGEHEAIITRQLFDRVKAAFDIRNYGQAVRTKKYPHFLKGTLFCPDCGSRLSLDKKKSKYGEWTYFFCLGTKRGRGCAHTKHYKAKDIEEQVEELYNDLQLKKEAAEKLRIRFQEELLAKNSTNAMEEQFLHHRMAKLADERVKLMNAYYAGAVTIDLLKTEQERINSDIESSKARLDVIGSQLSQLAYILDLALGVATSCGMGYKTAQSNKKKLYNQAFFEKIYVKNGVIVDYKTTDLFYSLLNDSEEVSMVDAITNYPKIYLLNKLDEEIDKLLAL